MSWFPNNILYETQFPIALIIEFVETLNREVKENTNTYFYYCYHGPRHSQPSTLMI